MTIIMSHMWNNCKRLFCTTFAFHSSGFSRSCIDTDSLSLMPSLSEICASGCGKWARRQGNVSLRTNAKYNRN
jgi:hypothetical protein